MDALWNYNHYNSEEYNVLKRFPILEVLSRSIGTNQYYSAIGEESYNNYMSTHIALKTIFNMHAQISFNINLNSINRIENLTSGVLSHITREYDYDIRERSGEEFLRAKPAKCCVNIYYVYRNIGDIFDKLDTEFGRYSPEHPSGDLLGVSVGFKQDRYHRVRIYKTKYYTYIFTNQKLSNLFIRKLYAIIPMLFDSVFNTEDELATNVFKNITMSCDDWLKSIKAYVETNLDETKIIAETIRTAFAGALQAQKTNAENTIKRCRDNIDNYLAQYSRALKELERQTALWARVFDTAAEDKCITEFLNFIIDKERNSCKLHQCGNSALRLDITTPVINYSVAEANTVISRQVSDVALRNLLLDIFVNQKYTLFMNSSIYWNINACYTGQGTPVYSERYDTKCTSGVPNPHHFFYSCYGDNTPATVKAMQNGQYIAAYLQLKSSVGSFNWTDGPVADNFLRYITDFNECYVDCPNAVKDNETGELYTIRGLYNIYEEEE